MLQTLNGVARQESPEVSIGLSEDTRQAFGHSFTCQDDSLEVRHLKAQVALLQARVAELEEIANLDLLVPLPNRRCFLRDLQLVLDQLDRDGGSAAMIFVDVDRLKQINDQVGHEAGDSALVEIAKILQENVGPSDIVARLSGDEFGVILAQSDELAAWRIALRVVEATLASSFAFEGVRVPLSVAVGVGVIAAGDNPKAVISRADKSMYKIKRVGPA